MAPCGLPALTGRQRLFTAGQGAQLSGRGAPFLSCAWRTPTPSPSLSGSHFYSVWASLSTVFSISFSEWTHPRSLSGHYLTTTPCSAHFHLLFPILKSSPPPSITCHTIFFICHSEETSLWKSFWAIITFPKRHFCYFCSFNSYISQISSLPIHSLPSVSALTLTHSLCSFLLPLFFHHLFTFSLFIFPSLCLCFIPLSFPNLCLYTSFRTATDGLCPPKLTGECYFT